MIKVGNYIPVDTKLQNCLNIHYFMYMNEK